MWWCRRTGEEEDRAEMGEEVCECDGDGNDTFSIRRFQRSGSSDTREGEEEKVLSWP